MQVLGIGIPASAQRVFSPGPGNQASPEITRSGTDNAIGRNQCCIELLEDRYRALAWRWCAIAEQALQANAELAQEVYGPLWIDTGQGSEDGGSARIVGSSN